MTDNAAMILDMIFDSIREYSATRNEMLRDAGQLLGRSRVSGITLMRVIKKIAAIKAGQLSSCRVA